jgi:hypothetical protein
VLNRSMTNYWLISVSPRLVGEGKNRGGGAGLRFPLKLFPIKVSSRSPREILLFITSTLSREIFNSYQIYQFFFSPFLAVFSTVTQIIRYAFLNCFGHLHRTFILFSHFWFPIHIQKQSSWQRFPYYRSREFTTYFN